MLSQEIALKLLQINAIRLSPQNPFTWASGMKSPVYCDNRLALSHQDARNLIVDAFVHRSVEFQPFDLVAGVATAGIAWGVLVADRLKLPFAYIRSSAKSHGRQNLIEGDIPGGSKVLVIEDLISTGGSSLSAVQAVRDHGAEVCGVLAIFQYNLKVAIDRFEKGKCRFGTLSDFATLISEAEQNGQITSDDLELLESWHKSPLEWSVTAKTVSE